MTDQITTSEITPSDLDNIDIMNSGAQPPESQTRVEIYTDGSCIGNPGFGGYGGVILRRSATGENVKRVEVRGHVAEETTNIRMEMTAACVALERLGKLTTEPITMFNDANLIPNTMNGDLAKWKAKGWRKSDGTPPANQDLWERLERAAEGRNVTWKWVRGHNGAVHNERADKLAKAESKKAEVKAAAL
jgi:ribonuclease HI